MLSSSTNLEEPVNALYAEGPVYLLTPLVLQHHLSPRMTQELPLWPQNKATTNDLLNVLVPLFLQEDYTNFRFIGTKFILIL